MQPKPVNHQILITGVSSGIGFYLAEYYLKNKYDVKGISRRTPERLMFDPGFKFEKADLAIHMTIIPVLERLFESQPLPNLVILNAGILSPIADMSDVALDDMKNVMDVNLWANKIILDWLFFRGFQKGQVVAISSGAAISASRGWNVYAISKAALNMMIALYATERPEIHFSSIAPGLVDTRMQEDICSLPIEAAEKFPAVKRLQSARGSEHMPSPQKLAPLLAGLIEKALQKPSGSYLDIRQQN